MDYIETRIAYSGTVSMLVTPVLLPDRSQMCGVTNTRPSTLQPEVNQADV